MKKLETKRLCLRGLRSTDLKAFYAYAKKLNIGPSAGWMPHPNLIHSKKILAMMMEKQETWGIAIRQNDSISGTISLSLKKNGLEQGEIGYVLDDIYWGQGLIAEAVERVIDYGFSDLKLKTILCKHEIGNNQSKRVIEKVGFKYIAQEQKERYDKKTITLLIYRMTKDNYLKGNKNDKSKN